MRSRIFLVAIAAAVLVIAARVYFSNHARTEVAGSAAPESRAKATSPLQVPPSESLAQPAALSTPPEKAENPPSPAPAPVEAKVAQAPPDSVGDPSTWSAEYADKQIEVLRADEKRLMDEYEKELQAEIDKRFKEGRVRSYVSGTEPLSGDTAGVTVGRAEGDMMNYVDIDPVKDANMFAKQQKSFWLKQEIQKPRSH